MQECDDAFEISPTQSVLVPRSLIQPAIDKHRYGKLFLRGEYVSALEGQLVLRVYTFRMEYNNEHGENALNLYHVDGADQGTGVHFSLNCPILLQSAVGEDELSTAPSPAPVSAQELPLSGAPAGMIARCNKADILLFGEVQKGVLPKRIAALEMQLSESIQEGSSLQSRMAHIEDEIERGESKGARKRKREIEQEK